MAEATSPLLRLPFEIRLMIYEYLLFPSAIPSSSHKTSITNLLPDFSTYASTDTNSSPFTLTVRTIDPYIDPHSSKRWKRRSTYLVRTGPLLTTTIPTTYRILLSPYTAHLRSNIPSLLTLNRQIHAESAALLYSRYTFNFGTSIEAAVPFLNDLTPVARKSIKHVALTKKAPPYTKEFDRLEWAALCRYLAAELCLQTLDLCVVAGRPRNDGWDNVPAVSKEDFEKLCEKSKVERGGGVDLGWVEHLFAITGLERVGVRAAVEHCPGPVSEAMAWWIVMSRSVEAGFADWLRWRMVERT